jgi:hypothetical protein
LGKKIEDEKKSQKVVTAFIRKIFNPDRKPDEMSYTLGWDVIASYAEDETNSLLADRYQKTGNDMLKKMALDLKLFNPLDEEFYDAHYDINFGPPLIQFKARSTSEPTCSLLIPLVSGAKQIPGGNLKPILPAWSIRLNAIPLATVKGVLTAEGKVQVDSNNGAKFVPGRLPIHFDLDKVE